MVSQCVESLEQAIIRAVAAICEQHSAMSREALVTAAIHFNPQIHVRALGRLLGRVAAIRDGTVRSAP